MSANQSIRYDFSKCTVEHVGRRTYTTTGGAYSPTRSSSEEAVVLRIKQGDYDNPDEALIILMEHDARGLASKILELLEADQ